MNGEYTKAEILSQPTVWESTIEKVIKELERVSTTIDDPFTKNFIVLGCGSTYYLSIVIAYLLRKQGFIANAYPSSEFLFFSDYMDLKNSVVVLISRSGTTTETLWALEKTRKQLSGTKIVTITVRPTSPLARNSDYVIAAPAADEKSVAQTRSFTSMHICAQVFIEHLSRRTPNLVWLEELPGDLEKLLHRYLSFVEHVGRDLTIERFIFLGGGSFYGIACEAMLKTKELAITWSEAYHPFELRHGPMSIVDPHSMIIGLISDQHQEAEIQVLKEMKHLGAKTLAITNNARSTDCSGVDDVLEIDSKLRDWQRGALYLPLIQWIGFNRSLAKGLDPDNPHNLLQVIELSGSKPSDIAD